MRYERLNITGRNPREAFESIERWANDLVDRLNYNLDAEEMKKIEDEDSTDKEI